jgi:hypothetical protein
MTDTIRAALEAAGRALCFGQNGLDCDTCLTADQCRKPGSWNVEAANTIAAFHTRMAEQHESQAAWFEAGRHRALAAAVEAAAKEAGE